MRSNITSSLIGHWSLGKLSPAGWRALILGFAAAWFTGCVTNDPPTSRTSSRVMDTSKTFSTVVIDAGHGGHDDGARSRWGGKEKNNALAVAKRLEPKLRAAGFKTVMTRSDDSFVELNERAGISNRQKNAVFVSIHFNDSPRKRISGSEVYYRSASSEPLARRILAKIAQKPGCRARFVKTANFRVLKLNTYPAVLVECGYMSNRGEGSMSSSAKHQENLAQAIASGLLEMRGPGPAIAEVRAASSSAVAEADTKPAATTKTALASVDREAKPRDGRTARNSDDSNSQSESKHSSRAHRAPRRH